MTHKTYIFLFSLTALVAASCNRGPESRVNESAERGMYSNPVLHADYSDPDVIREGDDYYMTASSFNCVPGLPLLHSKDLIHWELTGYALDRLEPAEEYKRVRHGGGVWAPSIRYHNNEYFIYYPDPDHGIYMVKAGDIQGPWSEPLLVKEGKGLIDPCPFWDEDGSAWLVHAFAGSRAGIKSVLVISRMSTDGEKAENESVMVFDGHNDNPTVEGPKLYKRNAYYYIFAPAGGVTYGWQLVMRSRNILGPYEARRVMHQGDTPVNGPHQGAWVTTPSGEDWFIHFQDKGAYGRVVHLQPMRWVDDWPIPGTDTNNDGIGEPVSSFPKPEIKVSPADQSLTTDDEFNGVRPGLQWQWQANPLPNWGYISGNMGFYRLNCIQTNDTSGNLWDVPNMMLQKFPAERFTATASMKFYPQADGDEAGFIVMGRDYQYISLVMKDGRVWVKVTRCADADKGATEEIIDIKEFAGQQIYFRVRVEEGALCRFSYSSDGSAFTDAGNTFKAREGMWIGAKTGFFALRKAFSNDSGYADIDWFRISSNE